MKKTRKTQQRKNLVDRLSKEIVYNHEKKVLNYKNDDAKMIIKNSLSRLAIYAQELLKKEPISNIDKIKKSQTMLLDNWTKENSIPPVLAFGAQVSPVLVFDDVTSNTKVAFTLTKGHNLDNVRRMLADGIILSSIGYDFSIVLVIDISENSMLKKSLDNPHEKEYINKLWDDYNVRVIVV